MNASINFSSVTAKKRPGLLLETFEPHYQAWCPCPKWRNSVLVFETWCLALSPSPSLKSLNLKPWNSLALSYILSSIWIGATGATTKDPFGITVASEKVKGFIAFLTEPTDIRRHSISESTLIEGMHAHWLFEKRIEFAHFHYRRFGPTFIWNQRFDLFSKRLCVFRICDQVV